MDENRSQRSMSAPPPDSRNQRFVSSINIPINQDGVGRSDMGNRGSAQPTESSQPNRPMERVIPIHVEGRDEPVIPKNASIPTQGSQQPHQGESMFGHGAAPFSQFMHKGSYSDTYQT